MNIMKIKDVQPDAKKNSITTLIAETAQLRGDLYLEESVHIKGKVIGNVFVQGDGMLLSVNGGARIDGNVQADIVYLAGTINGNIRAKLLKLHATSVVVGEIQYERLLVDEGASIDSTRISNTTGRVVEVIPEATDQPV